MIRFLFCESSHSFGGQESQILIQMEALQEAGHTARLACPADSPLAKEATRRGLPWTSVPFKSSLHPTSIFRLKKIIRGEKIDALLCHSGHDANVAAIAKALSFRRQTVVLRIRTYLANRVRPLTVNFLTDRTLAPSEFLRGSIVKGQGINPQRVGVLRPIVATEKIRQQASLPIDADLGAWMDSRSPIIVHAAMLRSRKGHAFALAVIARLKSKFPRLGYVIAGMGKNEQLLRDLAEKEDLGGNVLFAGMVQTMAPLFRRADVVIMPSRFEPLGLAQLEAVSLGVPVAVSDVGGLPETIVDGVTGRVFPSENLDAWVDGLTEIFGTLARNSELASRGKSFVEERYSAKAFVGSLLKHLEEIRAVR